MKTQVVYKISSMKVKLQIVALIRSPFTTFSDIKLMRFNSNQNHATNKNKNSLSISNAKHKKNQKMISNLGLKKLRATLNIDLRRFWLRI